MKRIMDGVSKSLLGCAMHSLLGDIVAAIRIRLWPFSDFPRPADE